MRHLASLWEAIVDGVVDIRGHKTRTLLQVVGIVLGVGSVVATFGLIDGGKRQMEAVYEETGGVRKVFIKNADMRRVDRTAEAKRSKGLTYADARNLARDATTLELVEPSIERRETIRAVGYEKSLGITGASPTYEAMYNFHPAEGRFLTDEDLVRGHKVVVLGATRRDEIFGSGGIGRTITIGGSSYTVVGVMQRKEFYFNTWSGNVLEWMNRKIFIPVTTVTARMSGDRIEQKISYMNVQVRDIGEMKKSMDEIETILRRAHGGVEDFEIINRSDQMQSMEEQGRIYDITFLVCGTISLLVGGIVIMNILLASFNERVREVGTRKALGATGLHIMAQFLIESVVITILGGVAGLALGVGFTHAISSLINQPVVLSLRIAMIGLLFAVTVGVFFGFYPAIKAARLNPVEALRYE
jgi:putative ABC transport system permease protein